MNELNLEYNLVAEYAALVIATVILLSFRKDFERKTPRYKLLRWIYVQVWVSIVVTILSTRAVENRFGIVVAPWITEFLNTVYYLFIPLGAVLYNLFALTFTKIFFNRKRLFRTAAIFVTPYLLYGIFVLTNVFTNLMFDVTSSGGYIRGPLSNVSYIVSIGYVVFSIFYIAFTVQTLYKDALWPLVLNILIVTGITLFQYLVEDITTSGIAGVTGVLLIHLYILNFDKSTDVLTNLRSRMAFSFSLHEDIKRNRKFDIYVFDIKNFKNINVKYDLEFGDKLLKTVAAELTQFFTRKEIYRYRGDTFAIIVKTKADSVKIEEVINRFESTFDVEDVECFLETNIVKVRYPKFGNTAEKLISAIDYSFQAIRESEECSRIYSDPKILKKSYKKRDKENSFKEAMHESQFVPHYQPIFNIKEDRFTSAEALVRLINKDNSLVYPNDFIELAEKTGDVVELNYIVLEKVCEDLKHLVEDKDFAIDDFFVSVNFSYLNFLRKDMCERVTYLLRKYGIPHSMIRLEITERALIADIKKVNKTIKKMQENGFSFELDDFGVDYSNMNALFDIKTDTIKIDRKLLLSATSKEMNAVFFRNLIKGIVDMKKTVIMEGVETVEHLEFAKDSGCTFAQGYLFSKPISFDEFKEILMNDKPCNWATVVSQETNENETDS